MDTPCESRPIDDRLQSPLHQVLDVEIEDIVNAGRFRKDSESEKTPKVLTFDLEFLFLCGAEERSCYPSYFREHRLMTSKLSLVSETILTKEMEFSFELFLAPGMARSLVCLPRLLRVSQALILLLFLLPSRCRACRFHENLLLDSYGFSGATGSPCSLASHFQSEGVSDSFPALDILHQIDIGLVSEREVRPDKVHVSSTFDVLSAIEQS